MLKAAVRLGWLDEERTMMEMSRHQAAGRSDREYFARRLAPVAAAGAVVGEIPMTNFQ